MCSSTFKPTPTWKVSGNSKGGGGCLDILWNHTICRMKIKYLELLVSSLKELDFLSVFLLLYSSSFSLTLLNSITLSFQFIDLSFQISLITFQFLNLSKQ